MNAIISAITRRPSTTHQHNQNPFGLAWGLHSHHVDNKMELVSRLAKMCRVDQIAECPFGIPLFFISLFFADLKLGSSFSLLKLKKQAAAPISRNNINASIERTMSNPITTWIKSGMETYKDREDWMAERVSE